MTLSVYGFDWNIYQEQVMPAFAHWLIDNEATSVYALYQRTRCARAEQFAPLAVQHLCTWPRAQTFVQKLPRGPQAIHEYRKLCNAKEFTLLSDRYQHRFPPQLYTTNDALCFVWGAIIEYYCLPRIQEEQEENTWSPADALMTTYAELLALLQLAGQHELASTVTEEFRLSSQKETTIADHALTSEEEGDSNTAIEKEEERPKGISIGKRSTLLYLRGWLASLSGQALALFELLASGRRTMPFGSQAGEPFGSYIGYLTPTEVIHLARCLSTNSSLTGQKAEKDFWRFLQEKTEMQSSYLSIIDEIDPGYARFFLEAVHKAVDLNLGLICSEDF